MVTVPTRSDNKSVPVPLKQSEKRPYQSPTISIKKKEPINWKGIGGVVGFVFEFIIVVLLLTLLVSFINDTNNIPTFRSLLEFMQGADVVKIDFTFQSIQLGDWGIFNFIRNFIGFQLGLIDLVIFFLNGIAMAFQYVLHFCTFIFGYVVG